MVILQQKWNMASALIDEHMPVVVIKQGHYDKIVSNIQN
jgi:glucosamine 6-phosphate synthetase-like amidotransferase/phosphosugar isomerase protein